MEQTVEAANFSGDNKINELKKGQNGTEGDSSQNWSSKKPTSWSGSTFVAGSAFGSENKTQYSSQKCRDFIRGRCQRGASCKYVHHDSDTFDGSGASGSKEQHLEFASSRGGDRDGWSFNRKRSRSPCKVTGDFDGKNLGRDRAPFCFGFLRGSCRYGASCRFLHRGTDIDDRNGCHGNKQRRLDIADTPRKADPTLELKEDLAPEISQQHDAVKSDDATGNEENEAESVNDVQLNDQSNKTSDTNGQKSGSFSESNACTSNIDVEDKENAFRSRYYDGNGIWRTPFGNGGNFAGRKHPREDTNGHEQCRKFLRGSCFRGASCRYRHDGFNRYSGPGFGEESKATTLRVPQEHDDVNRNDMQQREDTYRLELCRKFLRGSCFRGASCRYRHDGFNNNEGPDFTEECTDTTLRVPQGHSEVKGNGMQHPGEQTGRQEQCRKFLRGSCFRGASCRYHHDEVNGNGMQFGPSFASTEAIIGEEHTAKSLSRSPSKCAGAIIEETSKTEPEKDAAHPRGYIAQVYPRQYTGKREACRNFRRGRCQRGESCPYLHEEVSKYEGPRWSSNNPEYSKAGATSTSADVGSANRDVSLRAPHENGDVAGGKMQPLDVKHDSSSFAGQKPTQNGRTRICFRYPRCFHGAFCKFLHVQPNDSDGLRSYHGNQLDSKVAATSANPNFNQRNGGDVSTMYQVRQEIQLHHSTIDGAIVDEIHAAGCEKSDGPPNILSRNGEAFGVNQHEHGSSRAANAHLPTPDIQLVSDKCFSGLPSSKRDQNPGTTKQRLVDSCLQTDVAPGHVSAVSLPQECIKKKDDTDNITGRPDSVGNRSDGDNLSSDKSIIDPPKEYVEKENGAVSDKILSTVPGAASCNEDKTVGAPVVNNHIDTELKNVESMNNGTSIAINAEKHCIDVSQMSLEPIIVRTSRKLLVLDLNGLLADIVPVYPDNYKPDKMISGKAVFKRPFCDDFLKFCFEKFEVGVWSSRTKKNVDKVVDFLMGSKRKNLLFCWDQSHCTVTGYRTMENKDKPLVLKELKKLWDKHENDLPWVKGVYNETNTLLLDDSPYKALRNPLNTAIFPNPYSFKNERDKSLGPRGDLRRYLDKLASAENIPKFVQKNPFGQKPITKSSESWSFYVKILNSDTNPKNGNPEKAPTDS